MSRLGKQSGPSSKTLGVGLAAVGRPGYINLGRSVDLPAKRPVDAMRARTYEVLDAAYEVGIRYVDVARSYGRAEEFLAGWLFEQNVDDVFVASKWGYEYTANWRVDADVHEVKRHDVEMLDKQYAETRATLGDRLRLYQVHSATLESGVLTNSSLHRRLAALRIEGLEVGLTVSGAEQATTIRQALDLRVDGEQLFTSVQATWNLLEPSSGAALAEAYDAGWRVVIKEALANGRLTDRGDAGAALGENSDVVALAAALAQTWASVVLSGAATADQVRSNAQALTVSAPNDLPDMVESAETYWKKRSALPWT